MDLATIRGQYPQYNDLTDSQLVDALHQKYYSDLPKEQVAKAVGYKDPKAEQSDVWAGFKTSFKQLPQLGWGLAAITAAGIESAAGEGGLATAAKKFSVGKMAEWDKSIAADSRDYYDLDKAWDAAKEGNFGALVDWAQWAVGYGVGQGLQVLGTAGVGKVGAQLLLKPAVEKVAGTWVGKEATEIAAKQLGAGAAAEEVAQLAATDAVKKAAVSNVAAKLGEHGAMAGYSFGMEGGEIGGDLAKKSVEENRSLTGSELARGLGATMLAGSLEYGENLLTLGGMKGKLPTPFAETGGVGGRLGRAAAGSAVAAPGEALTEYLQTGIEEYGKGNEQNLLPFNQSPEAQKQAFNAAGLGAVGGATHATVGGLISGARAPKDTSLDRALDRVEAARNEVYLGTSDGRETLANIVAAPDLAAAVDAAEASVPTMEELLQQKRTAAAERVAQELGYGPLAAPVADLQEASARRERAIAGVQAELGMPQATPADNRTAEQIVADFETKRAAAIAELQGSPAAGAASPVDFEAKRKAAAERAIGEMGDSLPRFRYSPQMQGQKQDAPSSEPDLVSAYVEQMRGTNTPAARAFVQLFESGRITRSDVADTIARQNPQNRAPAQPEVPSNATPMQAEGLQIERNRARPGPTLDLKSPEAAVAERAQQQGEPDISPELAQQRLEAARAPEPVTPTQAQQYIAALRLENTDQARALVKEYEAGRVTDQDIADAVNAQRRYQLGGVDLAQNRIEGAAAQAPGPAQGLQVEASGARPANPALAEAVALYGDRPLTAQDLTVEGATARVERAAQGAQPAQQGSIVVEQGLEPRGAFRGRNEAIRFGNTNVPRPARIGNQPAASYSEQQLQSIIGNENLPAITRRGAQIELLARQQEQRSAQPATPAGVTPGGIIIPSEQRTVAPGATNVAQEATVLNQGQRVAFDPSQQTIVNPVTLPAQSSAQPNVLSKQTHRLVSLLASMFGKKVVVFDHPDASAPDGYVREGDTRTIYLNRRSEVSHLVVFGHELLHQLKRDNPAAYNALVKVIKLQDGVDLNVPGIRGNMEELTADLVGNRFRDEQFWGDVFRTILADNAGSKGKNAVMRLGASVTRAVNRMVKALRGATAFDTDSMVENLQEVKSAVTRALATYAQAQRGEATQLIREQVNASRQESQQGSVQQERGRGNESRASAEAGPGNRVLGAKEGAGPEGEERQGVVASEKRIPDTPEFRTWSGGHPVVAIGDANKYNFRTGEPVVVEGLHGTKRDFDRVDTAAASGGYFLSNRPVVSNEYAGYLEGRPNEVRQGGNVQRQYVRMDNPLVINARGASFNRIDTRAVPGFPLQMSNTDMINQWAKQNGYDGVIYKDLRDSMSSPDGKNAPPSMVYGTFKPNYVKSAIGNSGAYSLENDSFVASEKRTPEQRAQEKAEKQRAREQKQANEKVEKSAANEQRRGSAALVSAKPGDNIATVTGRRGRDLERLHSRAEVILRAKPAQDLLTSLGVKSYQLVTYNGSWKGKPELSFFLTAKGADGEPLDFKRSRGLAALFASVFQQDAAITSEAVTNAPDDATDIVPALYFGRPDGKELTASEVSKAFKAFNASGEDASLTPDGKSLKFLYFGNTSEYENYVKKLRGVAASLKLTGEHFAYNHGVLDSFEEKDSDGNVTEGYTRVVRETWDSATPAGAPGVLERATDSLLVPYILAVRAEGFGFDFARWQQVNGATRQQRVALERKVAEAEAANRHGLVPRLRETIDTSKLPRVPISAQISQKTTNGNAVEQLQILDELQQNNPKPLSSDKAFLAFEAEAYGSNDVPVAPRNLINQLMDYGAGIVAQLRRLTPGQIQDANDGFANGRKFRELYESGQVPVETTGQLMLWSFLSRGVSPYVQESMFLDAIRGVRPFVAAAARGNFGPDKQAEYARWAGSIKGSNGVSPGNGTIHNLNAFGEYFLTRMSERMPDGRTKLQYLHDMFSDASMTGKEIRREFVKMSEGVGIDNKVISFTLLVIGHTDVVVLDRVQMKNVFDDGTFAKYNLYDGTYRTAIRRKKKKAGKDEDNDGEVVQTTDEYGNALDDELSNETGDSETFAMVEQREGESDPAFDERVAREMERVAKEQGLPLKQLVGVRTVKPGSGMAALTAGVRGLMLYESIEAELKRVLPRVYEQLGRPQDASPGRWHWESWVVTSGQEASHGTLDALLHEVEGRARPFADVTVKQGEYGNTDYGVRYARDASNQQYFLYDDQFGNTYRMAPAQWREWLAGAKKVMPKGFKVSMNEDRSDRTEPWFMDPRIDRDKLDAVTRKLGEPVNSRSGGGVVASEKRQTETPEFKRWFGDSKVVDENGEPLVVYHGTGNSFSTFMENARLERSGFYFTTSPEFASNFARSSAAGIEYETDEEAQGSNVMPVYLSVKNPIDVRNGWPTKLAEQLDDVINFEWLTTLPPSDFWLAMDGNDGAAIKSKLESLGYDGLIATEAGAPVYVAFRPEQIKSAIGNSGAFDPSNPDITASEKRIFDPSGRTYTAEQKKAMGNVGFAVDVPTWKERLTALRQGLGKKMAQGIADQFRPIKDLNKQAYALARLSKGAAGAVEALLKHGKLSLTKDGAYDADTTGGALERVFMPLRNEVTDFLRWVAAYRAADLTQQDRENLFGKDDIAALKTLDQGTTDFDYVLRNGKATRDRTLIYKDALQNYDEFNRNVLDMAEQSGLISKDVRKTLGATMYVPFYRESDDGTAYGSGSASALVRQQAFKKLKGGTAKLQPDLLQNVLMNWGNIIDASARNRAGLATLKAAVDMGVAVEAPESTVRDMAGSIEKRKGVVWVQDEGVKRYYLVEDPYLLEAVSSLQYSGMKGPIMDAMSAFKHWLTIGVTSSPAFKIRNLVRDSMTAVATAPLSANLLENVREGYRSGRAQDASYVSALAGGGLIRFNDMLEGNQASRVRQLIRMGTDDSTILDSPDKLQTLRNKFEKAFMAYNELGNISEEVNRLALYKKLKAEGFSDAEANLAARDLMDFSMQGTWSSVRFLSQVVPFLNARIQGLYKLGRATAEDPKRVGAVLGAVALASLALAAGYSDDDDWKKREDWDRNNFWWFKVGGVAFRIPKPFELGAIATLAERGMDFVWDKNMTGARYGKIVKDLLMDNLSMNPIPQAFKPILDIYSNRNSFTGRPIETMGMERLKPDYRFTQGTSMLARGVSTAGQSVVEAAGLDRTGARFLSPVQVDALIHGYFSWLGSLVTATSDIIARQATGQPTRPTMDYYKFATQNIVQEVDSGSSYFVSALYDQAKIIEQAYGTWRQLLKEGRSQDAAEFYAANKADINRYRSIERVKSGEAKFNEMIRMIERSAKDPDVKKAEIQRVRDMQDRLARVVTEVR